MGVSSLQHSYPLLEEKYKWLEKESGPKILHEALKQYGVYEFKGAENNPVIIEWAKEVDDRDDDWLGGWYDKDSIPWCGLFVGICAKRAGFPFNQKLLSALEWANWGSPVDVPMLGDVLIFKRTGGGHVGFYVGEDDECFHVLGGNQSDSVNITRIRKNRFFAVRRCKWKIAQPKNVRMIKLSSDGIVSENEQ